MADETHTPTAHQIARGIARTLIPASGRAALYRQWVRAQRMRAAANLSTPMFLAPTYAEDGLISQHICDFLTDPRFATAYSAAREGITEDHPGGTRFRAYIACWAAEHALALDGDFVECGVAHGIFSRTICAYLNFETQPKHFFLFDTFRGIPVETLEDASEIASAERFNITHYANDLLPIVQKRFSQFPNVAIVPGSVPEALHGSAPERIAYLSIDMNNAPAEIGAITYLWDRLVSGAVILLDDYAYGPEFANQKRAWDKFATEKGFSILTLPTGQGMFFKRNI